MNPAAESLAHRLVGALLTGGYQGLLLTLAVAAALRFWRGTNASTRYVVQFATLLLVAALPVVHFILDAPAVPLATAPTAPIASPALAPTPEPALSTDATEPAEFAPTRAEPSRPPTPASEVADPVEHPPVWTRSLAAGDARPPLTETETAAATEFAVEEMPDDADDHAESTDAAPPWFPDLMPSRWHAALPAPLSLALAAAVGLFAAVRLAALAWQWLTLLLLKRRSRAVTGRVARLYTALQDESPGARRAVLLSSPAVPSPIALGYWRPAVLLPQVLLEDPLVEWEGILRHELAHVRRRDDWTNLLQQALRAAYGFHPGVAWLCRRLTVDREIACDDHVLAAMRSPGDYALLLTDLAGRMRGRSWAAAPAAWNHPSQLKQRIHMILDTRRNASPRVVPAGAGLLGTFAIIVALLGFHVAPRVAVAADTVPEAPVVAEAPPAPPVPPAPPSEAAHPVPAALPAPAAAPTPTVLVSPDGSSLALVSDSRARIEIRNDDDGTSLTSDAPKQKDKSKSRERGATKRKDAETYSSGSTASAGTAPVPPTPPVPAVGPVIIARPGHAAVHTTPPKPEDPDDADRLERRLERLERLVESLKRRDVLTLGKPNVDLAPETRVRIETETKIAKSLADAADRQKEHAKTVEKLARLDGKNQYAGREFEFGKEFPKDFAFNFDGHALSEMLNQVSREVEQATRDAMKAATAAAQSARAQAWSADVAQRQGTALKERRHALDEQRRVLQKQLGTIERQLERLDEQLDRVDEHLDAAAEAAEAAEAADAATTAKAAAEKAAAKAAAKAAKSTGTSPDAPPAKTE